MKIKDKDIGGTKNATKSQKEIVRQLFDAKAEQSVVNANVRNLEKQVKSIIKDMPDFEVVTYQVVKGVRIKIRAGYLPSVSKSIDKKALLKIIGKNAYAECATVTQAVITSNFGSNTLDQCIIEVDTKRFSVKRI
jgi:hypothetical protein